jgi:hypothetical protein
LICIQAQANDPIAAARSGAYVSAGVLTVLVAVVALFFALFDVPITTTRRLTGAGALVRIAVVAVIAPFAGALMTVTTSSALTRIDAAVRLD